MLRRALVASLLAAAVGAVPAAACVQPLCSVEVREIECVGLGYCAPGSNCKVNVGYCAPGGNCIVNVGYCDDTDLPVGL